MQVLAHGSVAQNGGQTEQVIAWRDDGNVGQPSSMPIQCGFAFKKIAPYPIFFR
jgi:hypothetical protein